MAHASPEQVAPPPDDGTRPPFLRRVRIKGYKSIAFCDVALQPLTHLSRKYSETVDQARFASKIDLAICRENSASFDKLCRELTRRWTPGV